MEFKDFEHQRTYQELLKITDGDNIETKSAMYVLAASYAPGLLELLKKHCHGKNAIDFQSILEEEEIKTWSNSDKALLNFASHLFSPKFFNDCSVMDIFSYLDKENAKVALEGIRYRFGIM